MAALTAALAAPEIAAGAADAAITLPEITAFAAPEAAAAAGVGAGELAVGGALAGEGALAATDLTAGVGAGGAAAPPPLTSTLTAPPPSIPSIGTPSPGLPGAPPTVGAAPPPAAGAIAPPPSVAPSGGISNIQSGFSGGGTGGGGLPSAADTTSFTANAGQQTATPGVANTGAGASGNVAGGQSTVSDAFKGSSLVETAANPKTQNTFSSFFNNPSLDTAGTALSSNPWLIGAGGIGLSAIEGQQQLPGQAGIKSAANSLATQGQQLQQYLQTGTLPPGVQGGIDQATQSAKAAIRSKYASSGSYGSSAEQEDLNNVTQLAAAQGANIAIQLLNTGISETGLSTQLFQYLMQNALSEDQALGQAISGFGASMIPRTVTVQNAPTGG
jgi:hypothetical protein